MHPCRRAFTLSPLNNPPTILDRAAGLVRHGPDRPSRVAIVGAGYGRESAPLNDAGWDVWALNLIAPIDATGRLRCDVWFDLHQRKAQSDDDMAWIAKCPVPIFVPPDLVDAGPNCVRFPLGSVVKEVGGRAYFACTFGLQIAFALYLGYKEIGLYGIDLARGTERERTVEWANTSWWAGYAAGQGVTVTIPPGSYLGRHRYVYGFQYDEEIAFVEHYLGKVAASEAEAAGG